MDFSISMEASRHASEILWSRVLFDFKSSTYECQRQCRTPGSPGAQFVHRSSAATFNIETLDPEDFPGRALPAALTLYRRRSNFQDVPWSVRPILLYAAVVDTGLLFYLYPHSVGSGKLLQHAMRYQRPLLLALLACQIGLLRICQVGLPDK
ncbi:hypothetical protein RRG08_057852 [Elysia crispata]|uniref:Uncharacterized protein n=1 Tax=Elysia crispata TaxID=231223 RepID=A0AAE1E6W0_9GAST|nr:hypothetical protein RRG08_057852 [Elysia crispata]